MLGSAILVIILARCEGISFGYCRQTIPISPLSACLSSGKGNSAAKPQGMAAHCTSLKLPFLSEAFLVFSSNSFSSLYLWLYNCSCNQVKKTPYFLYCAPESLYFSKKLFYFYFEIKKGKSSDFSELLFRNPFEFQIIGAGNVTRTHDLLITNQLLYRLSYTSILLFQAYASAPYLDRFPSRILRV